MSHVYLMRHGQTFDNEDHVWPRSDCPLAPLGVEQAQTASIEAARHGPFGLIIASPTLRTQQTAHIVAQEIGYPCSNIVCFDPLRERDFGELTGTPNADFLNGARAYQELDEFPSVETFARVQARAEQALDVLRLVAKLDEPTLVVAHKALGRALIYAAQGLPPETAYETGAPGGLTNTEIVRLL